MVIMVNLSPEEYRIQNGDRIAQMIISKHEQAEWEEVADLSETKRGAGGFGHTGVNWLLSINEHEESIHNIDVLISFIWLCACFLWPGFA